MKLIKLTRSTNERPIWINTRSIVAFHGVDAGLDKDMRTKIELFDGVTHTVKEKPLEVIEKLGLEEDPNRESIFR